MPKLRGIRYRTTIDIYDSFHPTKGGSSVRLLGRENIGNFVLTNMQVPRQLNGSDLTTIILNVRARTNVENKFALPALGAALHEFAHSTTVFVVVGEMPCRQYCLADLLERRPFDLAKYRQEDGLQETIEQEDFLAMRAFEAWLGPDRVTFGESDKLAAAWRELSAEDRAGWRRAAACAMGQVGLVNRAIVVPVCQSCSIQVDMSAHARAKLADLMPPDIAPQPLVWVHLEGFATRDVA